MAKTNELRLNDAHRKVGEVRGQEGIIALDAGLAKQGDDVLLGGLGVASDNQQQIGSEVSHLDSILRRSRTEI